MKRWKRIVPAIIIAIVLGLGFSNAPDDPAKELTAIPPGFPAIEFPAENAFSMARWELGKRLFFDPVMSRDSSISCASCHHPGKAFSDTVAMSPGVANAPGVRNAPSLANVAYHPYFTRDGGVPTLEMQVLVPIQEHNEFDFNIVLISKRLMRDSSYHKMAQAAYSRPPDHFVITRALACFERTLLSGNSLYDQWKQGRRKAMSSSARAGMKLFNSERAQCSTCHTGFNFTNYAFENTGLYQHYADSGRIRLTHLEEDRARFKVPGLRNVAVTAPYMHDGSLPTLEAVVAHYNSGGHAHKHKSALVKPLGLTAREQRQLVAFLESLTDTEFLNQPHFQQN